MQLKQRIKKIEETFGVNNTGEKHCDCFEKSKDLLEEWYNARQAGKEVDFPVTCDARNSENGICNSCKKPVPTGINKFEEAAQKQYDAKNKRENSDA
jgi:hypothetical protein